MPDPLSLDIPSLDPGKIPAPPPASRNGHHADRPATRPSAPPRSPATRGFNVLLWRGRLAAEPEPYSSPNGTRVLRIRCVQDQPDRNGQPGVQSVDLVLFNERADQFAAFFHKGDEVLVKGRLTIEVRQDRGVVRTTTSLHPDGSIELLHRPAT